jgi:cytochrome c-type biogenesis protein CcmH/NrfG
MDHYEMLIDTMQLLPDVSEDLVGILSENPDDPRLRRLLGDSYMRRNMLQQALEAYRSALDRL